MRSYRSVLPSDHASINELLLKTTGSCSNNETPCYEQRCFQGYLEILLATAATFLWNPDFSNSRFSEPDNSNLTGRFPWICVQTVEHFTYPNSGILQPIIVSLGNLRIQGSTVSPHSCMRCGPLTVQKYFLPYRGQGDKWYFGFVLRRQ